MGRIGSRVGSVVFALGVSALVALACSGTTDTSTPPGGGGGASSSGGSGGTSVGLDAAWPDSPGGFPGTGGSIAGSGGATGGSGASTGGSGAASGGGSGTGGASGGSTGGSGGCASAESCNNKDDNCNGQIDENLTQNCTTSCGSGTQTCAAGVWSACSALQPKTCLNYASCKSEPQCVATCPSAPPESCNLKDDNCDSNCDDFANCRQGVHRSAKPGEHFYTTSLAEAGCCGFTVEFQNFFYLYKAQTGSLVAFYRCVLANGKHFYTTSSSCEGSAGSVQEGVIGYIASSAVCGSVPLYRTSHANGEHFYTTSLAEKNNAVATLGYVDEGVAGYVWSGP